MSSFLHCTTISWCFISITLFRNWYNILKKEWIDWTSNLDMFYSHVLNHKTYPLQPVVVSSSIALQYKSSIKIDVYMLSFLVHFRNVLLLYFSQNRIIFDYKRKGFNNTFLGQIFYITHFYVPLTRLKMFKLFIAFSK